MGRPRNNIMKLDAETRLRVCKLLDDGATYDEIREDEIIAAECAEKKLTLHNRSFLAYRTGNEFDEFRKRRFEWAEDMERDKMASILVESENAPDDIARLANYKLLRLCMEKLEDQEGLTEKEIRAISGAVASYNRNRIAEEKEDTKRAAAEKEAEYQAKIAELAALVEKQAEKINELSVKAGSNAAAAVIKEMDKFVKGE